MTSPTHLTKVYIHLDRLTDNIKLLQDQVGTKKIWPAIKANAYGHGIEHLARHLISLGYTTLCVANIIEAVTLQESGINARFIILSAMLPEHAIPIVTGGCEPVVCTVEMADALSKAAVQLEKTVAIHIKIDTGMGRTGIRPQDVTPFLHHCTALPNLKIRGLMSHFASADHCDKTLAKEQLKQFNKAVHAASSFDIEYFHMANSAGIFDIENSYYDAVRPGIAIYGLQPSGEIINHRVAELKPILEWKTQITFLKEVPADTGLSYGHTYYTTHPTLIATVPVGYGDGLNRSLSGNFEMLIHGKRCPQIGRITMDQCLIDVTPLRGQIKCNDEVVIIGKQGQEEITVDELANKLGTINYEVVTAIAARVPRIIIAENYIHSQKGCI